ncbi:MAG TPA: pyrrolysine--tRNA(Pyl) ligase small subunit [Desulfotignum sp.]|nr:pyrrolysine--tRNA(Pyl) ligase small subunit [Desulfotignum sp.]
MADKAEKKQAGPVKKRFYRKRARLFNLIAKIKLWPSRTGQLHGIRTIVVTGDTAELTTHCNKVFKIRNSLNSRAGRWIRNKWAVSVCPVCNVPEWKLEKYAATRFNRHHGSMLEPRDRTPVCHAKSRTEEQDHDPAAAR